MGSRPRQPGPGRRIAATLGVVAMCVFSTLGGAPSAMPEIISPEPDALRPASVHRVIDGDSVELFIDGRVVRYELSGADSPDAVAAGRPPIPGSERAWELLTLLIQGERLVVLDDPRRETDALGRRRGFLYRSPEMTLVNLEMVRLGMARHASRDWAWNAPVFRWAQAQARASGKGIWDPAFERRARRERERLAAELARQRAAEIEERDDRADESETARDGSETDDQGDRDEPEVFVTRAGSKYHREGCRHLTDSAAPRSLEEVHDTHEACKVCRPPEPGGDDAG